MREIKFRAWQDNTMLYSKGCGVYKTKEFLDKLYEDCNLMQYTDLKDKNGKEIYEGDIVKHKDIAWKPKEVIYGKFWAGFTLKDTDYFLSSYWLDDLEIIGNIYENPELLEEK